MIFKPMHPASDTRAAVRAVYAAPMRLEPCTEPLTALQGECLARLVEASRQVVRRYQFFGWMQNHVLRLLPHIGVACGHWQRSRRELGFDIFHSVVFSPGLLRLLSDSESVLLQGCMSAWTEGRGRPLLLSLPYFIGPCAPAAQQLRNELGDAHLAVHGVGRPGRPHELETIFLLVVPASVTGFGQVLRMLDLLLPTLHSTWQQVVATEEALNLALPAAPRALPAPVPAATDGATLTLRERQILGWVRDGKSNHEIGSVLAISPLTVKNHLQKILRKLGASNRAQAVALAMKSGQLDAAS